MPRQPAAGAGPDPAAHFRRLHHAAAADPAEHAVDGAQQLPGQPGGRGAAGRAGRPAGHRDVDGRPQLLNLKQMLEAFVRHRREVVTRRTIFELRKARARAHILEGLTVALANIDEMIELIKTSANPNEARERMLARTWEPGLVGALLAAAGSEASRPEDLPLGVGLVAGAYQLTETQAQQILEMRLHRLPGLEKSEEGRGG